MRGKSRLIYTLCKDCRAADKQVCLLTQISGLQQDSLANLEINLGDM